MLALVQLEYTASYYRRILVPLVPDLALKAPVSI